jgi:hypothetical protein
MKGSSPSVELKSVKTLADVDPKVLAKLVANAAAGKKRTSVIWFS